MSFAEPRYSAHEPEPAKRDPIDHLVDVLGQWAERRQSEGREARIPEPLPADHRGAANAWMGRYQEHRRHDEHVQRTTGGEIDPYITRLVSSLSAFLNLAPKWQAFVIAAIEEGVPYRGDRMSMYADIYQETMRMREVGVEAYRVEAVKRARAECGITIPLTGGGHG